jgi:hypothetical protein
MPPPIQVNLRLGRTFRLRGWPALMLLMAILFALAALSGHTRSPSRPRTLTVRDLERLEAAHRRAPQNSKVWVDLILGYAEFLESFGGMRKLASSAEALAETSIRSRGNPKMIELKAKTHAAVERYFAHVGITSDEHWDRVLARGLELAKETDRRQDLDRPQAAAAHLAAARLYLGNDRPAAALEELSQGEKLNADRVLVSFVRADIMTYEKHYAEAIQVLRQASLDLTAWEDRPPSLETRILVAIAGRRARWQERRWRQWKAQLAHHLRQAIRDEVMVLEAQEKFERKFRAR